MKKYSLERLREIQSKISAIYDKRDAEKRELTDAENDELKAYEREIKEMSLAAACEKAELLIPAGAPNAREQFDSFLRENNGKRVEITLKRETQTVSTVGPVTPLTINETIDALREDTIYDKVGLPIKTGLAGSYQWPLLGEVKAEVAGETVELSDKKIPLDKIVPSPKRVGVAIPVTIEAVNASNGSIYDLVQKELPKAVAQLINKRTFTTDETITDALVGPFKALAQKTAVPTSSLSTRAARRNAYHISFAAALPTYAELLAMTGVVLSKNVKANNCAFVMDKYTAACLKAQPRDAGSGLMCIENDMIAGYPVFTTQEINGDGYTHIGFGDFWYLPIGQFGDLNFVYDPYSAAKAGEVNFVLQGLWSITTLKQEAFVIGTCAGGRGSDSED